MIKTVKVSVEIDMKSVKKNVFVLSVFFMIMLGSCGKQDEQVMDNDDMKSSYFQISQEQAAQMMFEYDGHIIVDVRTQDEYDEGHIPRAICIPNESITNTQPEELPDLDQVILVYCRSGRRSKEASQKLSDIGYTNVYEFGGILDWTGEIVTDGAQKDEMIDGA